MPTYTFRGRDMNEAVEQVRNMLGSDAVIIDTLRGTDHIGRFVEITATGELKSQNPNVVEALPQGFNRNRQMQLTQSGQTLSAPRSTRLSPMRNSNTDRQRADISPPSARPQYQQGSQYPQQAPQYPQQAPQYPQQAPQYPQQAPQYPQQGQSTPYPASTQPRVASSLSNPMRRGQAYQSNQINTQGFPSPKPLAPHQPVLPQTNQVSHARNDISALNLLNQGGVDSSFSNQRIQPPQLNPVANIPPIHPMVSAPADANFQVVQQIAQNATQNIYVKEKLDEIVSYIKQNQNHLGMPPSVFEHLRILSKQLQATGIDPKFADMLIDKTKANLNLNQLDKQTILAHLGRVLSQNLPCISPLDVPTGHKNVLAFVGPTGVGKTTTIAKIAAHAQLTHELPVTLISTDTFRMAAVEQLSRYAEILACPVHAAKTAEELWQLIDKATTPLVLVDTTGRNPKTTGQLKNLASLFGAGWTGRTVLTVAANTRERDLKPIVDGFAPLKYDMVAITKLDETYALGTVYNVSQYTKCPIAWLTHGQRVPEDIELANPEKIAVKVIMEALSHKQL